MGFLKSWVPFILGAMLVMGCANEEKEKGTHSGNVHAQQNLLLLLAAGDSVQVLFYKKPYTDSIRYTRYFTQYATGDSLFLKTIREELDQPFEIKNTRNSCLSDGKLYLLKNGEPLKTLYFTTDCNTCCYLYVIQDGRFYYFTLTDKLLQMLKAAQKKAA